MEKITRFYIGLEGADKQKQYSREDVEKYIKEYVDAGTFFKATGLWHGDFENSIVFEVVNFSEVSSISAEFLKEKLEKEFNQESVLKIEFGACAEF